MSFVISPVISPKLFKQFLISIDNNSPDNPLLVGKDIGVVLLKNTLSDDQRTVTINASNTTSDIFHVRKGSKLAYMTMAHHLAPAAAVGFPSGDTIAENIGGG